MRDWMFSSFSIAQRQRAVPGGCHTSGFRGGSRSRGPNFGTGYSAGGQALTNVNPTTSGTTAFTDFADETFTTATITARGALIYNTTPNTTSISVTNPAVVVLDFGGDKTSTAGDFTIVFPTADASNAIIRIA